MAATFREQASEEELRDRNAPPEDAEILALTNIRKGSDPAYRLGSDRLENFDSRCSAILRNEPEKAQGLVQRLEAIDAAYWVWLTGMHADTRHIFIRRLSGNRLSGS